MTFTSRDNECCRRCQTCTTKTCNDTWPPNTCTHGDVVCEECRPGNCTDCAEEMPDDAA